jgi:hypothetical protein
MFCTYITIHQGTGKFYIGKSEERIIEKGYRGSGTYINRGLKKYPDGWETGVLWTFETCDEALSDEGGIVTEELLADPLCLNLDLGGGRTHSKRVQEGIRQRHIGSKRSKVTCGKISKKAKEGLANGTRKNPWQKEWDEIGYVQQLRLFKAGSPRVPEGWQPRPDARVFWKEGRVSHLKDKPQAPEHRAKVGAKLKGRKHSVESNRKVSATKTGRKIFVDEHGNRKFFTPGTEPPGFTLPIK